MADNTILSIGTGGDTIATDDIGAIKYQRVKLVEGADGVNDGDISAANPLPVEQPNKKASGALGALNAAVSASGQGSGVIHWEIDVGTLVGTVVFEATLDDANWFAINAIRIGGAIISSTSSFADRGALDCAGYSQVRLRVSIYTSGTSNARLEVSKGSAIVRLGQALPTGTNSIGIVDTELPAASALADGAGNPTTPLIGAALEGFNGTTWDRIRGDIANGLDVDVTRVSGTVVVDSELATAAALADAAANPTTAMVGAALLEFNGTTWDRARGDTTNGIDVDVTRVSGTVTVDSELPAAAALADATTNPTAPSVGAMGHVFNGTTWDRARGSTTGTQIIGGIAHNTANSAANNPQIAGMEAIAHGTNPTAVAAGSVTKQYASRAGVPFVIAGHPNIITRRDNFTAAQTDVAIVTIATGLKIVVTRISVMASHANTVDVAARVGFGATTTPTAVGVLISHPGIAAGSGVVEGSGSGILGVGADGEDLRITSGVPTTGSIDVVTSYYTIES